MKIFLLTITDVNLTIACFYQFVNNKTVLKYVQVLCKKNISLNTCNTIEKLQIMKKKKKKKLFQSFHINTQVCVHRDLVCPSG